MTLSPVKRESAWNRFLGKVSGFHLETGLGTRLLRWKKAPLAFGVERKGPEGTLPSHAASSPRDPRGAVGSPWSSCLGGRRRVGAEEYPEEARACEPVLANG